MRILHSYTIYRPQDQLETAAFVKQLEYPLASELVSNPDGYYNFLSRYWGKETLVNIEQDIVPTNKHIENLLACSYPACTVPYQLTSGWSVWRGRYDALDQLAEMIRYNPPFPEYVECSGLGLVKINTNLQKLIPLDDVHWSLIDMQISQHMQQRLGIRWHVHTPSVKHNHY